MSVDACVVCVFVCVYTFHVWGANACAHTFVFMCMCMETGFWRLGDGLTLLLSRDLTQVQIVQLDSHSGDSLCVSLALELCMDQHSWLALVRG